MHQRQARLEAAAAPQGVFTAGLGQGKQLRSQFPEALHRWRHVHGALVSRRHQLTISAGKHFKLEPKVNFGPSDSLGAGTIVTVHNTLHMSHVFRATSVLCSLVSPISRASLFC